MHGCSARRATGGVEPEEAGSGGRGSAVSGEQPGGLRGGRGGFAHRAGRRPALRFLILRGLGRRRFRRFRRGGGGPLPGPLPRMDSSRNEMSLRPRSTESSIGVMPSTFRAFRSAPRLIASRAVAMSPRLIASNSASFGCRSEGGRSGGATISFETRAPGRAGGGGAGGGPAFLALLPRPGPAISCASPAVGTMSTPAASAARRTKRDAICSMRTSSIPCPGSTKRSRHSNRRRRPSRRDRVPAARRRAGEPARRRGS